MKRTISLVTDFTRYPGGRYRKHGKYSGEEFRETVLRPIVQNNESVVIDLDGAFTIPPSFLDEAFGPLVREYGVEKVRHCFEIRLTDDDDAAQELEDVLRTNS